jgi:hypothetical protein
MNPSWFDVTDATREIQRQLKIRIYVHTVHSTFERDYSRRIQEYCWLSVHRRINHNRLRWATASSPLRSRWPGGAVRERPSPPPCGSKSSRPDGTTTSSQRFNESLHFHT